MRDERAAMSVEVRTRSLLFIIHRCAFMVLLLCLTGYDVAAQSGRRSQPQGSASPSSSSPAGKSVAPDAPVTNGMATLRLSLFVADSYQSESVLPTVAREIFNSFVERLRDRSDHIQVKTERDLSRKEAVDHAKTETQGYVVWLRLETMLAEDAATAKDNYLVVNYVVFAPQTAEVKTEGRVYYRQAVEPDSKDNKQRERRLKQARLHLPVEETLEETGRAAADRVLAAFKDLLTA